MILAAMSRVGYSMTPSKTVVLLVMEAKLAEKRFSSFTSINSNATVLGNTLEERGGPGN